MGSFIFLGSLAVSSFCGRRFSLPQEALRNTEEVKVPTLVAKDGRRVGQSSHWARRARFTSGADEGVRPYTRIGIYL
jgi:hypothetical protein